MTFLIVGFGEIKFYESVVFGDFFQVASAFSDATDFFIKIVTSLPKRLGQETDAKPAVGSESPAGHLTGEMMGGARVFQQELE